MTPGTLDPRITFTRASTATYTDATGTIQTAATNAPRWDYDPVTHQLRGLLIEEARTNIALQSAVGSSPWTAWGSITAPTETPNAVAAPDGTLTATSLAFPAVTAGATSILYQNITPTAAPYAFSAWLRGAVGGERVWLAVANGAIYYSAPAVLTSAWRRFVLITPTLPAASLPFYVGVDLRDATQTPTSAQTVYAWGGQVEQGAFATSYIPTAAAAVTRAQDSCAIPPANMAPWFISPGGSWFAEFDFFNPSPGNSRIVGPTNVAGGITPLFLTAAPVNGSAYDGVGAIASTNPTTPNSVVKMVSTWAVGQAKFVTNAGAVASTASMTAGYAALGSSGTSFMMVSPTLADNTSGHLRRVSYWPRALSDAEMQQVTT
jgi:hypothetical protein